MMNATSPLSAATLLTAAQSMDKQQQGQNKSAVTNSAHEFEAMYLSEMFSHMFDGLETDPMFGGGKGEEMFRGMLVNEYAKKIAQGRGLGISDAVQKAMLDMQEKMGGAQ